MVGGSDSLRALRLLLPEIFGCKTLWVRAGQGGVKWECEEDAEATISFQPIAARPWQKKDYKDKR